MTELDELKQRLEIEELRGRLSAAEKQISILTDTLATLTEIQTSDRLGSYINSQVRLLKAAEFLNSVSDGEKIASQLQQQSVEQAGLRKAELDAHISRTVQLSKEKSSVEATRIFDMDSLNLHRHYSVMKKKRKKAENKEEK